MDPTIAELYLAYRQAKIALFYERRGVGLLELAKFESNLTENLSDLRQRLEVQTWFDGTNVGEVWVVPKKLHTAGDNQRTITNIGRSPDNANDRRLDVQVRLGPSPEFAIVEVLYLWKFGPALDAVLDEHSMGYRLDLRDGHIRRQRRWLFEYWPSQYQQYRTQPLDAAKEVLENDGSRISVISTDLASYYNTIDPSFLLQDEFITSLTHPADGIEFDPAEYRVATRSLLDAYERFRTEVTARIGHPMTTGIPIAALTSRVVANVALQTLDDHLSTQESVTCYRRYVDDMVVVAKEKQPADVSTVLRDLFPFASQEDSTFHLDVEALQRPGSEFQLQKKKISIHNLTGMPGQDFINAVKTDFDRVVSARRAFLDTPTLFENAASHLIRVGEEAGSPLRVLRNADRSRLERFSLSTSIETLERVSSMVDQDDALSLIRSTLERISRVLNEEENWVENLDIAFRLIKLAISTGDWESFADLNAPMVANWNSVDALKEAVGRLYFRGQPIRRDRRRTWVWLRNYLHYRRLEAVSAAIPVDIQPGQVGQSLSDGLTVETRSMGIVALRNRAELLSVADLRARDREKDNAIAFDKSYPRLRALLSQNASLRDRLQKIRKFVSRCDELNDSPWLMAPAKLFLCTRPPSYFDIARRWLYRAESHGFSENIFQELLEIVNAVRGTNYRDPVGRVLDKHTVEIPRQHFAPWGPHPDPKLILGNLVNKQEWWQRSATIQPGSKIGAPYLGLDRLKGLHAVLRRADRISAATSRPTLLVLPELSLPRPWLREVARHVVKYGGYGLVAGLEYLHKPQDRQVLNQAFAVLPGPFSSVATWPWTKRLPARVEQQHLQALSPPVKFPPLTNAKIRRTVVHSAWGKFSVLICSELIESRRVADLVGRIELGLCPSWNQDTSSYDHLIQSVGLQLHAIIAVANDGHYSDCRVWAPKKVRWQRNLCRLIERDVNDVVHVELPIQSLREFHRRHPVSRKREHQEGHPQDSGKDWRPLPPDWPDEQL